MRPRLFIIAPLEENREASIDRAIDAGRMAITLGWAPLIPNLSNILDPHDALGAEAWYDIDRSWIPCAQAVLRLPGRSSIADDEAALADELDIPCALTWDALAEIRAHIDGTWAEWEKQFA